MIKSKVYFSMKVAGFAAALALAPLAMTSPAFAFGHGGGGGGGGHMGGGSFGHAGGGMAFHAAPTFRAGPAGPSIAARNSFASTNVATANVAGPGTRTWNGSNWQGGNWHGGRFHHHRGPFVVGFGGYWGPYYDDAYYDDSYYDTANGYYDQTPTVTSGASCAQLYRSYDPASGTYLGYDGLRHPCP